MSIILIFLGIGLLISCIFITIKKLDFIKNSRTSNGTVVSMVSDGEYDSPVVEFKLPEQKTIRFTAKIGSNFNPEVGSTVQVLYNPDNPNEAEILSYLHQWFFSAFTFIMGASFLLFGINLLLKN